MINDLCVCVCVCVCVCLTNDLTNRPTVKDRLNIIKSPVLHPICLGNPVNYVSFQTGNIIIAFFCNSGILSIHLNPLLKIRYFKIKFFKAVKI